MRRGPLNRELTLDKQKRTPDDHILFDIIDGALIDRWEAISDLKMRDQPWLTR